MVGALVLGVLAVAGVAGPAPPSVHRADFFDDVRRTFQKDIPRTFEQDIPRAFGVVPKKGVEREGGVKGKPAALPAERR